MIRIRNPYIDYDKFGHCVACHDTLIVKQVIDGKEEDRALPNLDEMTFVLNDNSKMKVTICRNCKAEIEESDYPALMDCVYKGWEFEIKNLTWSEEKKLDYLTKYKEKSIIKRI